MLPVLGAFLAPFAVYEAVLASRVIRIRRGNRISLDNKMRDPPTNRKGADPLTVAIRAHGNFIEGVPFALVIAAVAELNGANKLLLGGSLGLLFVSRVLHAEYGLLRNQYAAGAGRAIGTAVTQIFIVLWAFGSAYLVRDQIL